MPLQRSSFKKKIPSIQRDRFWEDWGEEIQEWLRQTLGIDLYSEFADNDWTLIVKLHAMIEAALNSAVVAKLEIPELEPVIARLETSNMKSGKVAFAQKLKIIDKESAIFLQQLSELRNFCVHDIRNFGFDLTKYASTELEDRNAENKRKALVKILNKQVPSGEEYSVQTKLKAGAVILFEHLHLNYLRCQNRKLRNELTAAKAEQYDVLHPATPTKAESIPQLPGLQAWLEYLSHGQTPHQE